MLDDLSLAWALRRNRLIASTRLRGLARWLPPARLPARRYARALFDLTAGFVYAQVAQALVESGLLRALERGPLGLAEAAAAAALDDTGAATLLKAAAALGLAEVHGERWTLGPLGAALAATPGLADMIRHHRLLYADLAEPLATLRGEGDGRLARLWRYDGAADPADIAAYSALMAATQPLVAEQALAAYPFRRHRRLLDVGGGAGAFLRQVRQAAPRLELGLFDRPAVAAQAQAALGPGVSCHGGSFFDDPLPLGYDLITLVRVLHDHDDAPASRLLRAARSALPPIGRLLIVEPLADTAGAQPMGHAYFGFYLAAMRSGRPRSLHEYRTMLAEAGFKRVRRHATPLPLIASAISAQI